MIELFVSDIHFPFEDKASWNLFLDVAEKVKPDLVFLGGDIMDCVTPETKILKYNLEWVQAEELKLGDELIGFDENSISKDKSGRNSSRKLRKSFITNIDKALQPVYALHMSDGTILRSSVGHKWLGWKGRKHRGIMEWMTTQEIACRVEEGRPVLLNKPTETWESQIDYESGYIAAAFDGEGHISFNHNANNFGHIVFSQRPNIFLSKVTAALRKKGFESRIQQSKDRNTADLYITGGFWKQASFIGSFDIPRFKNKWLEKAPLDGFAKFGANRAEVIGVEFQGIQEIVSIETSTKTYIAEGFASHNCYAVSKYDKDPRRKLTFQDDINYAKEELKRLRKICPRAIIVYHEGNHETRLTRYLQSKAEELSALDALHLKNLLGLADLDIKWIDNGTRIPIGKLWHLHGNEIAGGGANVARAKFTKLGANIIFGHHHIMQNYIKRNYEGETKGAWANGCLCLLQPEYSHFTEWIHSFAVIDYAKSGNFNVDQVPIIKVAGDENKASCMLRGKEFFFDAADYKNPFEDASSRKDESRIDTFAESLI